MALTKQGAFGLPPKTLSHLDSKDGSVFCLFPWLFRFYDRETAYIEAAQKLDKNIPLVYFQNGDEGPLVADFNRKPGSSRPSRIARPANGKVEILKGDMIAGLDYIVISYTWGRWMEKDRSRDTHLEGCHWKVPATTLFTRQELDSAVLKIARGRNFWLDVMCIPQDDSDPEKGQEINKQGDIFSNAAGAAVWLASGGETVLQTICSWTDENASIPALDLNPTNDHGLKDETISRLNVLQSLREAIPWTTSLWTLQETALRRDAVFHGKDGSEVLSLRSGKPIIVEDLVRVMTQIEMDLRMLRAIEYNLKKQDRAISQSTLATVDSVALGNLENMTARDLYLASSRRVCQRGHDRVYAIMNALGVLVPVDYSAPLKTVQEAFILKLYNSYPAEMHSFLEFMHDPGVAFVSPSAQGIRARSLSQMRQSLVPNEPSGEFTDFTSDGFLVAVNALRLDNTCIENICSLLREALAVICYDDKGQDRLWQEEDRNAQLLRTSLNLRYISQSERLVLIPMGRLRATPHVGPTHAYLLCLEGRRGRDSSGITRVFRIGVLVSKKRIDEMVKNIITVAVKHDLAGGEGTPGAEQSSRWLCDGETPLYLHPPWPVYDGCSCLPDLPEEEY